MKRLCSALLSVALCLCLSVPALGAEGQSVHATLDSPTVLVEGERVYFLDHEKKQRDAITYNGTVYIPLTTAGLWMGADAVWSKDNKTVSVISNGSNVYYTSWKQNATGAEWAFDAEQSQYDYENGVDVQLCPDVTVTIDGVVRNFANVLGEPTYPLLFREEIYLPLRSIGELCGKQVAWFPWGYRNGTIYLCCPPTQEELTEAKSYFAAVRGCTETVRAVAVGAHPQTKEQFTNQVREIQTALKAICDLPTPSFRVLEQDVEFLQMNAQLALAENVDPYLPEEESSGADLAIGMTSRRDHVLNFASTDTLDSKWTHFASFIVTNQPDTTTYFMDLEQTCAENEAFLTAIGE